MERVSNGAAQAWRERIEAHRASGLSIRAWCRQNNCHEHAFYLWRCRLGLSPAAAMRRRRDAAGPIRFTEVVADRGASESIRLRLAGGRELVLPASMPIAELAQLIRAIEGQDSITQGHDSIIEGLS